MQRTELRAEKGRRIGDGLFLSSQNVRLFREGSDRRGLVVLDVEDRV